MFGCRWSAYVYDLGMELLVGIDDYGIRNLENKYCLNGFIEYLRKKSFNDALKIAGESSVLLIIEPPDSKGILLVSKLVDYIQTGRPILAITPDGETLHSILNNDGGGIAVDNDAPDEILSALLKLYEKWKEGILDTVYGSQKLLHLFTPATIIKQYEEIFSKLIRHE
jgi:glycosyltransferase involved in cell wall biosynthesis